MKTDDAIALFGSIRALAEELKVTPQAVYQWGPTVPELREYQIREKRPDFDAEVESLRSRQVA